MSVPKDCKFTKDHEWAKKEGSTVRVGITDYAQRELGDVVFVDLPKVGASVSAGKSFATVESVKAVSDIYAPVSGTIKEVNAALSDSPQLVNESPYSEAWMVVIEAYDAAHEGLMSADDYEKYVSDISK